MVTVWCVWATLAMWLLDCSIRDRFWLFVYLILSFWHCHRNVETYSFPVYTCHLALSQKQMYCHFPLTSTPSSISATHYMYISQVFSLWLTQSHRQCGNLIYAKITNPQCPENWLYVDNNTSQICIPGK